MASESTVVKEKRSFILRKFRDEQKYIDDPENAIPYQIIKWGDDQPTVVTRLNELTGAVISKRVFHDGRDPSGVSDED